MADLDPTIVWATQRPQTRHVVTREGGTPCALPKSMFRALQERLQTHAGAAARPGPVERTIAE